MTAEKKALIKKCIQACINSYEGKHGKVITLFEKWVRVVYKEYIEYYFGYEGDTVYLVFRGSDEKKDWQQNLDTASFDIEDGEMQRGTLEDWFRIEKDILSVLENYKKIVITGHSRGAMLALVANYFAAELKKEIVCVAVAPAKVISKELLHYYYNAYVIMNGEDIVCKQPFWKFADLKQFKNFIRIGKQNIFFKIPVLRLGLAWLTEKIGINDHEPELYLKNWLEYEKL